MRSVSRTRDSDERGAVAIIVAVLMTSLLIITAMVLDFGLVRIDRQIDRAAADEATLAGLYALDQGDGAPHPFAGVCEAVSYLEANSDRFDGATTGGVWKNGSGGSPGNGCAPPLTEVVCDPDDKTTWAVWSWSRTYRGVDLDVTIESGYDLTANNGWQEDGLPATAGDVGDDAGCDNLAVTISQSREPGLGSLATDSDLETAIRTVGRVRTSDGDSAPAMLLLKQTGCPMLKTGAAVSPNTSWIRVYGAVTTDGTGRTQPGTIHSDSDGSGCTGANNSWIYGGRGAGGIVAYAAPLAADETSPDPAKPGSITAYAASLGLSGAPIRDALENVYGSSVLSGLGGAKADVTGRPRVTRKYLDERYFAGVKCALSGCAAHSAVPGAVSVHSAGASAWSSIPTATATMPGWTPLLASDRCNPTQAEVNTAVAAAAATSGKLYINCRNNLGFGGRASSSVTDLTIDASQVYFAGVVSPSVRLHLPNATKVYIGNHGDRASALSMTGTAQSFAVNDDEVDASGSCTVGVNPSSRQAVFVRAGDIQMSGGTLRMCRTTLFMLGGVTTSVGTTGPGCLPNAVGSAPTTTPCNGGTGSGQLTMTASSSVNWTAPNTMDQTSVDGAPLDAAVEAWADPNGPEDLAFWSESYGGSSNPTYSMTGSGALSVVGVFAAPNADPFSIGGGSGQTLINAQYIASSIALNGANTQLAMTVDPNAAVTVPEVELVGLVR